MVPVTVAVFPRVNVEDATAMDMALVFAPVIRGVYKRSALTRQIIPHRHSLLN